uniref:hypothetical protein n=1 Tax=Nitzschia dissipata TaxID=303402 RepID=UPI00202878F9|nr:hypothetical protein NDD97_mgp21 [Nitzschia dissipata]QYB23064.1 hypothetical protein [Nitzschia dissipata]
MLLVWGLGHSIGWEILFSITKPSEFKTKVANNYIYFILNVTTTQTLPKGLISFNSFLGTLISKITVKFFLGEISTNQFFLLWGFCQLFFHITVFSMLFGYYILCRAHPRLGNSFINNLKKYASPNLLELVGITKKTKKMIR